MNKKSKILIGPKSVQRTIWILEDSFSDQFEDYNLDTQSSFGTIYFDDWLGIFATKSDSRYHEFLKPRWMSGRFGLPNWECISARETRTTLTV